VDIINLLVNSGNFSVYLVRWLIIFRQVETVECAVCERLGGLV